MLILFRNNFYKEEGFVYKLKGICFREKIGKRC